MNIQDFSIGLVFKCGAGMAWQCTDRGTRTVVAIMYGGSGHQDTDTISGMPEIVFNEEEISKCTVVKAAARNNAEVPGNLESDLTLRALPDYELRFQNAITELVMRHIDRMNDVCEQDTADNIIESFTTQFDALFEPYLNEKFPQRMAMLAAVAKRRAEALSVGTTTSRSSRTGRPPRRRTQE